MEEVTSSAMNLKQPQKSHSDKVTAGGRSFSDMSGRELVGRGHITKGTPRVISSSSGSDGCGRDKHFGTDRWRGRT